MAFPIGAIFAGDPIGRYQETSQKGMKAVQEQLDEQAAALFGKSLQDLFQSAVPGASPLPPGGVQSVPTVGSGGRQQAPNPATAPSQPAAGAAPAGSAAPPTGQPPGSILPFKTGGRPEELLGPGRSQSTTGDVGKSPPGGGEGGQEPASQGPLTLQQVIQSIVKTGGPKVNPAVIAGAVQKYIPLMNAQSQQQAREMLNNYRENSIFARERGLDIRQQEADRRDQAEKDKVDHWRQLESDKAKTLDMAEQRFNLALQKQDIAGADREVAQITQLISQRRQDAFQLGIPFDPKQEAALYQQRDQLQQKANQLRAALARANQIRQQGGGTAGPVPPAAQSGGGDVPYAPPQ
ncbi:MAG TPA: hypothetical protein VF748_14750 [Candidatus Acidoferrum sp.]